MIVYGGFVMKKKVLAVVLSGLVLASTGSLTACLNNGEEQPADGNGQTQTDPEKELTYEELLQKRNELQSQLNDIDSNLYNKYTGIAEERDKIQKELEQALAEKEEISKDSEEKSKKIEELENKLKDLESKFDMTEKLLTLQETVENIEDAVQFATHKEAEELMKNITQADTLVSELTTNLIITKQEAETIRKTLDSVQRVLFYNVYANGVNELADSSVILESSAVEEVGKPVSYVVSLSDFNANKSVSLTTFEDETIKAETLDQLTKRQTVVGESYKESQNNTILSTTYFKTKMKTSYQLAVENATGLEYSPADGFKITTKGNYNKYDCIAEIEYNVDEYGSLCDVKTVYKTKEGEKEIATVSTEYKDYSSNLNYFTNLYSRATKILDEQESLHQESKEN